MRSYGAWWSETCRYSRRWFEESSKLKTDRSTKHGGVSVFSSMGILPGHAPLLSELGDGELSYTSGGRTERLHISGGYVEVRDDHVRVLADKAE